MSRKTCEWCGDSLIFEDVKLGYKWCSRKCENRNYYQRRKDLHRKKYQQARKEWLRSPIGQQAGITMRNWWKMSKFYKERR